MTLLSELTGPQDPIQRRAQEYQNATTLARAAAQTDATIQLGAARDQFLAGAPGGEQLMNQRQQLLNAAPAIGTQSPWEVNSLGSAASYAANIAGQLAPVMAPAMMGGMAGAALAPAKLGAMAQTIGGVLGAAAPSYGTMYNMNLVEQMNDPVLAQRAAQEQRDMASGVAMHQAALEALMPGALAGKAFSGRMLPAAIGGMGVEAGTEAAQDYVSQKAAMNVDPTRQLDTDRLYENAIAGAVGGGMMSGAMGDVRQAPGVAADPIAHLRESVAPLTNAMDEQFNALRARTSMNSTTGGIDNIPIVGGIASRVREADLMPEGLVHDATQMGKSVADYAKKIPTNLDHATRYAQSPGEFASIAAKGLNWNTTATNILDDAGGYAAEARYDEDYTAAIQESDRRSTAAMQTILQQMQAAPDVNDIDKARATELAQTDLTDYAKRREAAAFVRKVTLPEVTRAAETRLKAGFEGDKRRRSLKTNFNLENVVIPAPEDAKLNDFIAEVYGDDVLTGLSEEGRLKSTKQHIVSFIANNLAELSDAVTTEDRSFRGNVDSIVGLQSMMGDKLNDKKAIAKLVDVFRSGKDSNAHANAIEGMFKLAQEASIAKMDAPNARQNAFYAHYLAEAQLPLEKFSEFAEVIDQAVLYGQGIGESDVQTSRELRDTLVKVLQNGGASVEKATNDVDTILQHYNSLSMARSKNDDGFQSLGGIFSAAFATEQEYSGEEADNTTEVDPSDVGEGTVADERGLTQFTVKGVKKGTAGKFTPGHNVYDKEALDQEQYNAEQTLRELADPTNPEAPNPVERVGYGTYISRKSQRLEDDIGNNAESQQRQYLDLLEAANDMIKDASKRHTDRSREDIGSLKAIIAAPLSPDPEAAAEQKKQKTSAQTTLTRLQKQIAEGNSTPEQFDHSVELQQLKSVPERLNPYMQTKEVRVLPDALYEAAGDFVYNPATGDFKNPVKKTLEKGYVYVRDALTQKKNISGMLAVARGKKTSKAKSLVALMEEYARHDAVRLEEALNDWSVIEYADDRSYMRDETLDKMRHKTYNYGAAATSKGLAKGLQGDALKKYITAEKLEMTRAEAKTVVHLEFTDGRKVALDTTKMAGSKSKAEETTQDFKNNTDRLEFRLLEALGSILARDDVAGITVPPDSVLLTKGYENSPAIGMGDKKNLGLRQAFFMKTDGGVHKVLTEYAYEGGKHSQMGIIKLQGDPAGYRIDLNKIKDMDKFLESLPEVEWVSSGNDLTGLPQELKGTKLTKGFTKILEATPNGKFFRVARGEAFTNHQQVRKARKEQQAAIVEGLTETIKALNKQILDVDTAWYLADSLAGKTTTQNSAAKKLSAQRKAQRDEEIAVLEGKIDNARAALHRAATMPRVAVLAKTTIPEPTAEGVKYVAMNKGMSLEQLMDAVNESKDESAQNIADAFDLIDPPPIVSEYGASYIMKDGFDNLDTMPAVISITGRETGEQATKREGELDHLHVYEAILNSWGGRQELLSEINEKTEGNPYTGIIATIQEQMTFLQAKIDFVADKREQHNVDKENFIGLGIGELSRSGMRGHKSGAQGMIRAHLTSTETLLELAKSAEVDAAALTRLEDAYALSIMLDATKMTNTEMGLVTDELIKAYEAVAAGIKLKSPVGLEKDMTEYGRTVKDFARFMSPAQRKQIAGKHREYNTAGRNKLPKKRVETLRKKYTAAFEAILKDYTPPPITDAGIKNPFLLRDQATPARTKEQVEAVKAARKGEAATQAALYELTNVTLPSQIEARQKDLSKYAAAYEKYAAANPTVGEFNPLQWSTNPSPTEIARDINDARNRGKEHPLADPTYLRSLDNSYFDMTGEYLFVGSPYREFSALNIATLKIPSLEEYEGMTLEEALAEQNRLTLSLHEERRIGVLRRRELRNRKRATKQGIERKEKDIPDPYSEPAYLPPKLKAELVRVLTLRGNALRQAEIEANRPYIRVVRALVDDAVRKQKITEARITEVLTGNGLPAEAKTRVTEAARRMLDNMDETWLKPMFSQAEMYDYKKSGGKVIPPKIKKYMDYMETRDSARAEKAMRASFAPAPAATTTTTTTTTKVAVQQYTRKTATIDYLNGGAVQQQAPVTQAPVTQAPATQAPATQAPATQAPVTPQKTPPTKKPKATYPTQRAVLANPNATLEEIAQAFASLLYKVHSDPVARTLSQDLHAKSRDLASRGLVQDPTNSPPIPPLEGSVEDTLKSAPLDAANSGQPTLESLQKAEEHFRDAARAEEKRFDDLVAERTAMRDRILVQIAESKTLSASEKLAERAKLDAQFAAFKKKIAARRKELAKQIGNVPPAPIPEVTEAMSLHGGVEHAHDIPPSLLAELTEAIRRMRGKDVVINFLHMLGSRSSSSTNAEGVRLINIALATQSPMSQAYHESMHDLMTVLNSDPATRQLYHDLRRTASTARVMYKLRELLKDSPDALEQIEHDPNERAAYMFQFYAEGVLNLKKDEGIVTKILNAVRRILGLIPLEERVLLMMEMLQSGGMAEPSAIHKAVMEGKFAAEQGSLAKFTSPLRWMVNRVFTISVDQLREMDIEAFDDLADLIWKPAEREGVGSREMGFTDDTQRVYARMMNEIAGLLKDTTSEQREAALRNLQNMQAPSTALEIAMSKYLDHIHSFLVKSGVQSFNPHTKQAVPLRKVANYFPRVWAVNEDNRGKFKNLIMKYGVDAASADATIGAMMQGDGLVEMADTPEHLGYTPIFQSAKARKFDFITPQNAHEFQEFQNNDLTYVLTTYAKQASHRGIFSKYFGDNASKLKQIYADAKAQGATEEQLERADTIVRGVLGSLGSNTNPYIRTVSNAMVTMQNLAILPLALLPSLLDPIGIAVRTGDLDDAWTTFKTGINDMMVDLGLVATDSKKGIDYKLRQALAEDLAIVQDQNTMDAMGYAHTSLFMGKTMTKINDKFFRWIGLNSWNNSMRRTATIMGMRYILANKDDAVAMRELGLERDDIREADGLLITHPHDINFQPTAADMASAARVQNALYKFVNSAILRPNAATRATWMSDPRFLILSHLKGFTYSMHHVIGRRVAHRADRGEYMPTSVAMAYIPGQIGVNLLRGMINGTFWQRDMSLSSAMIGNAIQTSGILGIGGFALSAVNDVNHTGIPGTSFLGPTVDGVGKILGAMVGNGSATDAVLRNLPGGTAFRGWI